MPHQCVQCGNFIPSGSQQILEGCSKCGAKKFLYTAEAVTDGERYAMRQRADRDIDDILNDVFTKEKELADALEEGGLLEEEWVKVTTAPDGKGGEVLIEKSPGDDGPDEGGGSGEDGAAGGAQAEGGSQKKDRKTRPVKVSVSKKKPVDSMQVMGVAASGKTGTGRPGSRDGRSVKGLKPHLTPEVVHMIEDGVYEIDLERLLDKSPVIINRDGTYLIHLPSVFGDPKKKAK